jgi:hypothetical protein
MNGHRTCYLNGWTGAFDKERVESYALHAHAVVDIEDADGHFEGRVTRVHMK